MRRSDGRETAGYDRSGGNEMSRSRRRGDRLDGVQPGWWTIALGLTVVILVSVHPAVLVTNANMGRVGSIDVVADENGVVGLDVYSSVRKNRIDPLVDITNHFNAQLSVTVALDDGADGDLYVNGNQVGDTATVAIAAASMETIEIDTAANPGSVITFDVTGSTAGTQMIADNRATSVDSAGNGGGGNGDTTPPTGSITDIRSSQQGNSNRYNVDVDWSASDNQDLSRVEVRVIDNSGTAVATSSSNARGTSDAGTEQLKVDNDPSGWTAELVVTDAAGNTNTTTQTIP